MLNYAHPEIPLPEGCGKGKGSLPVSRISRPAFPARDRALSIPPFRYTQYMILDGLEGDHELVFYKHVIMILLLLPNFGLYWVFFSIRTNQRPRITETEMVLAARKFIFCYYCLLELLNPSSYNIWNSICIHFEANHPTLTSLLHREL